MQLYFCTELHPDTGVPLPSAPCGFHISPGFLSPGKNQSCSIPGRQWECKARYWFCLVPPPHPPTWLERECRRPVGGKESYTPKRTVKVFIFSLTASLPNLFHPFSFSVAILGFPHKLNPVFQIGQWNSFAMLKSFPELNQETWGSQATLQLAGMQLAIKGTVNKVYWK